jgi:hypothetical protein
VNNSTRHGYLSVAVKGGRPIGGCSHPSQLKVQNRPPSSNSMGRCYSMSGSQSAFAFKATMGDGGHKQLHPYVEIEVPSPSYDDTPLMSDFRTPLLEVHS